jgi:hypothetical protein
VKSSEVRRVKDRYWWTAEWGGFRSMLSIIFREWEVVDAHRVPILSLNGPPGYVVEELIAPTGETEIVSLPRFLWWALSGKWRRNSSLSTPPSRRLPRAMVVR